MRILNTGGMMIARRKSKVMLYANKTCPSASLTANSTEKSLRKKLSVPLLLKRFLAFCGTQRSIIVIIRLLRLMSSALNVSGISSRRGMNISWCFSKQSSCGLWIGGLSGGPCIGFSFTAGFHNYFQSPLSTSPHAPKIFFKLLMIHKVRGISFHHIFLLPRVSFPIG